MTVVLAADETEALARAAAALEQGAVVGVPTDTVYGLVCLCSDAAAIDRLFAVKERPAEKALPVLLGDDQQARAVVEGPLPPAARLLMGALLARSAHPRAAGAAASAQRPHGRKGDRRRAAARAALSARAGPPPSAPWPPPAPTAAARPRVQPQRPCWTSWTAASPCSSMPDRRRSPSPAPFWT